MPATRLNELNFSWLILFNLTQFDSIQLNPTEFNLTQIYTKCVIIDSIKLF